MVDADLARLDERLAHAPHLDWPAAQLPTAASRATERPGVFGPLRCCRAGAGGI